VRWMALDTPFLSAAWRAARILDLSLT